MRSARRLARLVGVPGALAVLSLGSAPVHAGVERAAPGHNQIALRLSHTLEVGSRGVHFKQVGAPLTINDGRGTGTLTAVLGGRYPSADGAGQVVFFWHNTTFNSQSARYETNRVISIRSPAPGTFAVTYARYQGGDPMCCPTLKPLKVTYGWSGSTLISNGVPPHSTSSPVTRYQP